MTEQQASTTRGIKSATRKSAPGPTATKSSSKPAGTGFNPANLVKFVYDGEDFTGTLREMTTSVLARSQGRPGTQLFLDAGTLRTYYPLHNAAPENDLKRMFALLYYDKPAHQLLIGQEQNKDTRSPEKYIIPIGSWPNSTRIYTLPKFPTPANSKITILAAIWGYELVKDASVYARLYDYAVTGSSFTVSDTLFYSGPIAGSYKTAAIFYQDKNGRVNVLTAVGNGAGKINFPYPCADASCPDNDGYVCNKGTDLFKLNCKNPVNGTIIQNSCASFDECYAGCEKNTKCKGLSFQNKASTTYTVFGQYIPNCQTFSKVTAVNTTATGSSMSFLRSSAKLP
ncbi:Hypothetical protein D9617_2g053550 [Elsinoe fawcettii]|nr:Hypothetical protein D9617_2g053550 [Elsinoe fawcettii]